MTSAPSTADLMPLIEEAAARLVAFGASAVYVFGSWARGDARPDSDVDLAVRGVSPSRFLEALGVAWDTVGRPVDLINLDIDSPFTRYLEEKGGLVRVG